MVEYELCGPPISLRTATKRKRCGDYFEVAILPFMLQLHLHDGLQQLQHAWTCDHQCFCFICMLRHSHQDADLQCSDSVHTMKHTAADTTTLAVHRCSLQGKEMAMSRVQYIRILTKVPHLLKQCQAALVVLAAEAGSQESVAIVGARVRTLLLHALPHCYSTLYLPCLRSYHVAYFSAAYERSSLALQQAWKVHKIWRSGSRSEGNIFDIM